MEKDVVCGMKVDMEETVFKSKYHGKMYYFCCEGCRSDFISTPEKYLKKPVGTS